MFKKKEQQPESSVDEREEVYTFLDELDTDPDVSVVGLEVESLAVADEGVDGSRSPMLSKKARRLVIGGAVALALLWLASRLLDEPASSGKEGDSAAPPADAPLEQLEVLINAIGFYIDGEQIAALSDGAKGFLLAAGLEQRGALPGKTLIVIDRTNAPHDPTEALIDALRERGYQTAIETSFSDAGGR